MMERVVRGKQEESVVCDQRTYLLILSPPLLDLLIENLFPLNRLLVLGKLRCLVAILLFKPRTLVDRKDGDERATALFRFALFRFSNTYM